MPNKLIDSLTKAKTFLQTQIPFKPKLGIVLGSGLGKVVELIEDPIIIPYGEIPDFPKPTVEGHQGTLYAGLLNGVPTIALAGRIHAYEGHSMDKVTFPVRLLAFTDVQTIILTNAAGGVKVGYNPGDVMMISDHLNLMGFNPLTGPNFPLGPRFLDLTDVYTERLRKSVRETIKEKGISMQEGVYAALSGPCYETPSEVKMLRSFGADAVGMSTVPEAIAASHMGVQVLGFSMISNLAAGMSGQKLSHEEVQDTATKTVSKLSSIIKLTAPLVVNPD